MLSSIQSLKADTRVNTEGFLSWMQPWGPKLTMPCTSQVSLADVQAKGPPESPCGRAEEKVLNILILIVTINHLFVSWSLQRSVFVKKVTWVFLREVNVSSIAFLKPSLQFWRVFCYISNIPRLCLHDHSLLQTNNVPIFPMSNYAWKPCSHLQSRLTDHKQKQMTGCYIKDNQERPGLLRNVWENNRAPSSSKGYQRVLLTCFYSSHLAGRLQLIWRLVSGTDHGGPEAVPPVGRLAAGVEVNDGKGCLI